MKHVTTYYQLDDVDKAVSDLQRGEDDGWSYIAIKPEPDTQPPNAYCAKIAIYDVKGTFISYW